VFGTNLPLAVTGKYQTWVIDSSSRGYVTAYFVFFGMVIALGLVIDGLIGFLSTRSRAPGRIAIGVFALVTFVVTYGTDFVNAHVAQSQRRLFDRAAAVDVWARSPLFKEMPAGSVVWAPSLWDRYPGETRVWDETLTPYWDHHVMRTSRRFRLRPRQDGVFDPIPEVRLLHLPASLEALRNSPGGVPDLYYLKVIQERRDDETYLVFARLLPGATGEPLRAGEVHILAHAKSDRFRVTGRLSDVAPECRGRVLVDGIPSSGTFTDLFAAHIDRMRQGKRWLWSRIDGAGATILPETIAVSASSQPTDGDVSIAFGAGFHDDEFVHRWATAEANLALGNRSGRDLTVDLHFEMHLPSAKPDQRFAVEVISGNSTQTLSVGKELERYVTRVTIPARATAPVAFRTDAPRLDVADSRQLVMMFKLPLRTEEVTSCAPAGAVTDTARASAAPRQAGG
jgi:hypothetical protein